MIPFLAMFLAATLATAPKTESEVRRITIDEYRAALAKGEAVAVDVRGSVPYELGHLEGAIWAPLGIIKEKAEELPKDKLLVLYCTCKAEELSVRAALELGKIGFTNVAALTGGYAAWVDKGLPVVKIQKAEEPPPPPTPWTGYPAPTAAPQARAGRLAPPAQIRCDANDVTVYNGRVVSYSRKTGKTTLTIRTDYDTTETVTLTHPKSSDPSKWFLLHFQPFKAADWKKIEVRKGVLHPGMRAHAWVCTNGKAIVDWRPGETEAVE